MTARRLLVKATLCCSLVAVAPASTAESPELVNNPFARPPSERIGPPPSARENSDGTVQVLELRATIVGTRDRFANVGGRVLRPGDDVQGYTLVKVYEDRAVFSRLGKQQTIYVKPDPVEDDE